MVVKIWGSVWGFLKGSMSKGSLGLLGGFYGFRAYGLGLLGGFYGFRVYGLGLLGGF